jgi:hypothetical protein
MDQCREPDRHRLPLRARLASGEAADGRGVVSDES